MASIIKRNTKYAVVYYADVDGKRKQMWESFDSHKEALSRKAEVEHEMDDRIFIPPNRQNVSDFLDEFISLYGEENWALSTYSSNVAMIDNYIKPIIGSELIQNITPKYVDQYYKKLKKAKPVAPQFRKTKSEYVGASVPENVHKLLRCAFKQAVRWELIKRNPFELVKAPRAAYAPREIWTAETIRKALDECDDSRLYIAMNLSFACSLRIGEILGLTWDNVHIDNKDIVRDDAYVYIDKELQRASLKAIKALDEKDIIRVFPSIQRDPKTLVVLKTPKTKSSVRKVWLPKTVAYILREFKEKQDVLKNLLQDEYEDYNLVIPVTNGRPCEEKLISEAFQRLRERVGLPNVVFHSLRHSSTTYKLKLNKGDLKATQGDTGHAEIDMITKVYAHILDEDRKLNAQKFEAAFYANPDLRGVKPPEEELTGVDVKILIEQLQKSPELANALAQAIK
jgi:integrase